MSSKTAGRKPDRRALAEARGLCEDSLANLLRIAEQSADDWDEADAVRSRAASMANRAVMAARRDQPPEPEARAVMPWTTAKVDLMAARAQRREALFSPGDMTRERLQQIVRLYGNLEMTRLKIWSPENDRFEHVAVMVRYDPGSRPVQVDLAELLALELAGKPKPSQPRSEREQLLDRVNDYLSRLDERRLAGAWEERLKRRVALPAARPPVRAEGGAA